MRNKFVDVISELACENKNIVLLTGDLGFGVLDSYWDKYPSQFINCGISEQNMASIAAGMALEGKIVFTYSIANFPTMRCLEQIRNDIAYHKANVKIVAVGAGFSYGALGMSHHATEDISIMRSLPEMTIFTPCDPYETEKVVRLSVNIEGPCYIRLGRGGESILHKDSPDMSLGEPLRLREGKDILFLSVGSITEEALNAVEILKEKHGKYCAVYSFATIKPVDKSLVEEMFTKFKYIFTIEEHNIIGGLGSAIAEIGMGFINNSIVTRIGLNDTYSSVVGSQKYLRKYYGMDSEGIVNKVLNVCGCE